MLSEVKTIYTYTNEFNRNGGEFVSKNWDYKYHAITENLHMFKNVTKNKHYYALYTCKL
jgi:hypothetical protein